MMKWRCELKMKFRREAYSPFRVFSRYRKRRVGLRFEWKAWLIAYSVFDIDPSEFSKMETVKQVNALVYGAAAWDCMERGRKIFFTYDDIATALDKATREENAMIGETIKEAKFPGWLEKQMGEATSSLKKKSR